MYLDFSVFKKQSKTISFILWFSSEFEILEERVEKLNILIIQCSAIWESLNI